MEKIKKLFFGINMTWPKVIIGAVVIGVIVGLLMVPESLQNTSAQDIGISLEWWILFALIIILNCNKPVEAMAKCFIFFLVSQPIIYAVQAPFADAGFSLFGYYGYWFKLTILTIPGAFIAYQVKRKDWLAVLILSVATGFLAYVAADYGMTMINAFPNHLVTVIFCIATAVIYCLAFFDEKKYKMAALAVVAIVFIGGACYMYSLSFEEATLPEGTWNVEVSNEEVADVTVNGSDIRFKAGNEGYTEVILTNQDGDVIGYDVTVHAGRIIAQQMN